MRPNLADYPFYRARMESSGRPAPWSLSDLEEFAGAHPGDPFAGRVLPGAKPMVAFQIEATGEPPVWIGLGSGELDQWAGVLTRMWRRWGCSPGEAVAFFDYGSSPLVLLASGGYLGYLRRGAAERLGLTAICNDGVASMAARMVTILETVKPSMLILRRDLAAPLISCLEATGMTPLAPLRWVALSEPEGVARRADAERVAASFGLPVYRILRCDAAFLLAGECSGCGLFHLDRLYRAQALASGEVAVTARFARLCPAAGYNIGSAKLVPPGCLLEPRAYRIECG